MLPNNNYIVRKLGTNKTQILHRIRLRKFTPTQTLSDIIVSQTDWERDEEIVVPQDDLYAITWETNFGDPPFESTNTQNSEEGNDTPVHFNADGARNDDENTEITIYPTEVDGIPPQSEPMIQEDARSSSSENTPGGSSGNETTPEHSTNNESESPIHDSTNARGGRYNLRPNPNPNFSDSYRY